MEIKRNTFKKYILVPCLIISIVPLNESVTMKQFLASLEMLRSACAPKFKVTTETLDNMRKGVFPEDQDVKCYTRCVSQMLGTLTRKGEISYQRTLAQIDIVLPVELQDKARSALEACKEIQNGYKESCDKTFYTVKCVYDFSPEDFVFP